MLLVAVRLQAADRPQSTEVCSQHLRRDRRRLRQGNAARVLHARATVAPRAAGGSV